MKIYKEGLADFEPWMGAVDTWDVLLRRNKIGVLETILEDVYFEGMRETDLNDLLWFEPETVYEWVGLCYDEESGEIF